MCVCVLRSGSRQGHDNSETVHTHTDGVRAPTKERFECLLVGHEPNMEAAGQPYGKISVYRYFGIPVSAYIESSSALWDSGRICTTKLSVGVCLSVLAL